MLKTFTGKALFFASESRDRIMGAKSFQVYSGDSILALALFWSFFNLLKKMLKTNIGRDAFQEFHLSPKVRDCWTTQKITTKEYILFEKI